MKAKLLFTIAAAGALLSSSCSMDLNPVGTLNDKDAIQSVNDAAAFRNGFYSTVRNLGTSQFFALSDIQADMFNGLVLNGNALGTIANGVILANDGDITSFWASLYSCISNTNYFLATVEPLYQQALDNKEYVKSAKYSRYIGEAHFFRGYYYALMFDRWCTVYDAAKGDQEGLGLPIVTTWDPTSDRSKYPGRSSMNATIKFINDELSLALTALSEYEENASGLDYTDQDEVATQVLAANACYVSSWAVRAMQARFALWTGQYQQAYDIATELIACPIYSLAKRDAYVNLWTKDTSTETIFQPTMSVNELSGSIGATWISSEKNSAYYIPIPTVISQYEEAGRNAILKTWNDIRCTAFIDDWSLQTPFGNIETPCFVKFPGTTEFDQSGIFLVNRPKLFRLSETYFIAMESAYKLGNEEKANELLATYLSNRITKYTHTNLSGTELQDKIRRERGLELIGEGFRLSDLRRWQQGFTRANEISYNTSDEVTSLLTPAGLTVVYEPTDHRYTWPIPADELQSNPQIKGQQNPGY